VTEQVEHGPFALLEPVVAPLDFWISSWVADIIPPYNIEDESCPDLITSPCSAYAYLSARQPGPPVAFVNSISHYARELLFTVKRPTEMRGTGTLRANVYPKPLPAKFTGSGALKRKTP